MAKVYKRRNPNVRRTAWLFILQVFLGVMPVVLFLIFIYNFKSTDYSVALIFIAVMLLGLALYITVGRRYNILLSGLRGERAVKKIAKGIKGDYIAFTNLPVRYKKNRSEIDLLLVGTNGILIVEVKNHSGTIVGSDLSPHWRQLKKYRKGKTSENEMENPFTQIKRQREILKSILRAENIDVWIDNVLFFSRPDVRLRLDISGESNYVCAGGDELKRFISAFRSEKPITKAKRDQIVSVLLKTD